MRALAWIVGGYALVWATGVAGIAAFIHLAGTEEQVFVARFHLQMLACILVAALFLEGAIVFWIARGGFRKMFAVLSGCLLGGAHTVMIAYYAALLFGLKSWGDVITRDLVMGFAREVPAMVGNMPFSVLPVIVASGVACLLLLAAHVLIAFRRLHAWRSIFAGTVPGLQLVKAGAAGLLVPLALFAISWTVYAEDAAYYSEPVTSLVLNRTWRDPAGAAGRALYDEQEHAQARAVYGSPQAKNPSNVILIVLDGARPDRMSVYGWPRPTTPYLQSLADSGQAFLVRQAYSTCANTACGIGGLLQSQSANRLVRDGFGLPDALQAAGYRTMFVLSGNHTDFFSLRRYYGRAPDVFRDGSTRSAFESTDDEWVLETLKSMDLDAGRPVFLMLHLMSSHVAGRRHDAYQKYSPRSARITDDLESKKVSYANHHDNGLLQSDDYIRRILAVLRDRGVLTNSMVVVTADHGDAMGEKGIFMHSQTVYEPEIRIPMLIVDSSPARYRRDRNVSLLDVAPTILDRLGLPVPAVWKGESLAREAVRKWTLHQMGLYAALIEWNHDGAGLKLVHHIRDGSSELYDLRSDPGEERNLFQERRQDSARLLVQLSLEQGMVRPNQPFTSSVSDQVWKQ